MIVQMDAENGLQVEQATHGQEETQFGTWSGQRKDVILQQEMDQKLTLTRIS